jgi:hypothetical protein
MEAPDDCGVGRFVWYWCRITFMAECYYSAGVTRYT